MDQHSWNPDPDTDPGFWWLKIGKNTTKKIYFLVKNCNLLIPKLLKGRPSYRRSLQPPKENIQHFKKWNLFNYFLMLSWMQGPRWIRIHYGSGSTTLHKTEMNPHRAWKLDTYSFGFDLLIGPAPELYIVAYLLHPANQVTARVLLQGSAQHLLTSNLMLLFNQRV